MTEPIPKTDAVLVPAVAALPRGDLLLPYQAKANLLISTSPLTVIDKSRRIGLTWGVAADSVLVAASARGEGGMDVFYTSYAHDMTREFIDACAMWAKAYGLGLGEIGEFLFEDQDTHGNSKFIKAFRIDFASGFSIVALSSSPRSLRGRQGLVIIDEAAFVNDLDEVLKAALALLIWGGRVVVISTHNGVDNPFNELIDEIESGKRKGAHLRITFNEALDQGFYKRICLTTGKTWTPEAEAEFEADVRAFYGEIAAEELDCIPSASAGSFIDPALIAAAEHDDANKPDLYTRGVCFGGRDVARRVDLSPMWVFELVGNVLWLRERREDRNITFKEQDEIFDGQFKRFRILRYGVDQTGMGEKVVEDAQLRHGARVEGILFTGPNRLQLAIAMKRRFEDGTIRIDASPEVRADFRAIKRAKGKGKGGATADNIRLVNEGKVHADRFWACALACFMADFGVVEIAFQSTGQKRGILAAARDERELDQSHGFGVVRSGTDMGDY